MDRREAPSAPKDIHRRSQLTSHQPLTFVRKRTLVIALLLATAVLLTAWQSGGFRFLGGQRAINAAAAPAHVTLYFTAVGKKQGAFKGDGLKTKGHELQMQALTFDYGIVSPRDVATGLPSGKRQHKPVVISKEWGPSMPQFLAAIANNEQLTKVTLEFWDTDPAKGGGQRLHFVVTLTNANVSEVRQRLANDLLTEDLSFTFQKIEVADKVGNTIFTDDWSLVA
jgi:type VI secretion system secreted protein Hcp